MFTCRTATFLVIEIAVTGFLPSSRSVGLLTLEAQTAIDDLRPLGRRGVVVCVVPVPPFVRRSLWIALRRVLPLLLAPERGDVEVVPSASHLLVAAVVDEVRAKNLLPVSDEGVR